MNNASKQSYVSIDPNQLKVGMYVILPSSWLHHPFFRSEFKVTSEKEIDKIINAGFNQILVDYSRGDVKAPEAAATQHANLKPPRKWKPEEIVPQGIERGYEQFSHTPGRKGRRAQKIFSGPYG